MGPKRFYSQNFSLCIVKFKKLGSSAPLSMTVCVYVLGLLLKMLLFFKLPNT